MRIDGKVSVITGAGSGLGRAVALRFAREGARIVASDVNRKGGEETLSLLKGQGYDGIFVETNVTSESDVQRLAAEAVDRYGRVDILVNNAGYMRVFPTLETPTDVWDYIFDVNVRGYFLTAKYVVPHIVAAGGGSIVNIGSIAGLSGSRGYAAYAASKAAVANFNRSLALSLRSRNVRSNCIMAGGIETPMAASTMEQAAAYAQDHPDELPLIPSFPQEPGLRLIAPPEEYAAVALFLVSDEASHVNGSTIVVDGGLTA